MGRWVGEWVSEQVIMSTNQGGSVVPDGVHSCYKSRG